jgi:hypothetical protein
MSHPSDGRALHIEFLQSQQRFSQALSLFDPEPQITAFSSNFTHLPAFGLTRLVTWSALLTDHTHLSPLYQLDTQLESQPLSGLICSDPTPLSHNHGPVADILTHQIDLVTWSIHILKHRNIYAPPYAPKTLYDSVLFTLDSHKLTVSFQRVSHTLWYIYDQNSTEVIPYTSDNFARVIDFFHGQVADCLRQQRG